MRRPPLAQSAFAPVATTAAAPATGARARRPSRAGATARRAIRFAKDPYRVVVLLLILLTVSRMHMEMPVVAKARPLIVLTIAALALAWVRPGLLAQRPLFLTWPAKVVAGLAIWSVLGMFFGMSFGGAATFIVEDFSKTIVFTFLILASIRTARDLYTIVVAYVVSAVWLVYQAVFHFHVELVDQNGGYYRLSHLDTYDANDLGLVLLFGLALTLLIFQVARWRGRIVAGGVTLGIAAAIAKSGSRGALLGLVAFGIALLFLLQNVPLWKRIMFIGATVAGLSAFAPQGYWRQMDTIFHPEQDYNWNSPHGRRQVARRGIGYFEQYPVFGLGVGNFEKAECSPEISPDARNRYAHGRGVACEPPHNSYVQALAESGVGGFVLWMVMIPGAAVWLVLLRRRMPQSWLTGGSEEQFLYFAPMYLAVGIIGFSVGAFFLTFAWREVTFFIPAVVAGLDAAVQERLGPVNKGAGRRVVRRWIARPWSWAPAPARGSPHGTL